MNSVFLAPFSCLAAIGFVLSVLIHLGIILGLLDTLDELAFPFTLGIFFVMIPAALLVAAQGKNNNREEMWHSVFRGWPTWIRWVVQQMDRYTAYRFWLIFFVPLVIVFVQNWWLGAVAGHFWGICLGAAISAIWAYFYGMSFLILYPLGKREALRAKEIE